jgi:hypothetical protein
MRVLGAVLLAGFWGAGAQAIAEDIRIEHAAIGCVVAERFPLIEARLDPADAVSRASVHFRTDAATHWYTVAMKADGPGFKAVLPKPKKSLARFQYYVDATDRAFATSRTPEQTVQVVPDPVGCQGRMMASTVASAASILLEVPAGAPVVPAGFGSAGVATGSAAGATSAAGASGGGGIGAGTVAAIVGGGAAVAGAAVAVAAAGGDGKGSDGDSGEVSVVYSVSFGPPPGMDVSVCVGSNLTWSGQSVVVRGGTGAFDVTWAPTQPNTLRATGTVTATAFNANIACVSGAASGTLSATGSGGTYTGTFALGASRGPLTVTRQ